MTQPSCATCKNWSPKKTDPAMARHRLAVCELRPRWEFYPPQAVCPKHTAADAKTVKARAEWLQKRASRG